jgi:hypothetical protein
LARSKPDSVKAVVAASTISSMRAGFLVLGMQ